MRRRTSAPSRKSAMPSWYLPLSRFCSSRPSETSVTASRWTVLFASRRRRMNAVRKIVVVGGGPAGVAAALAAKQQDAAADVVLLSDESQEPYEKPPLSKAVLTGKAMPHDAPIAGPKGVAASGVRLKL